MVISGRGAESAISNADCAKLKGNQRRWRRRRQADDDNLECGVVPVSACQLPVAFGPLQGKWSACGGPSDHEGDDIDNDN